MGSADEIDIDTHGGARSGRGRARRRDGRGRLAPWLVLAIGVSLTVGGSWWVRESTTREHAAAIRQESEQVAIEVEEALSQQENVLRGIQGLFASSQGVTEEEFDSYVESLLLPTRFPGVFGIAWVRPIPADRVAEFVAGNAIEAPIQPELGPGSLDVSYLITHAAPAANMSIARGIDARLFEPVSATLEAARDVGATRLGGRFVIPLRHGVDSPDDLPVMFPLVAPVFDDDLPSRTVEDRSTAIVAWVGVLTDAEPFLASLDAASSGRWRLELHDGTAAGDSSLLAASGPVASGTAREVPIEIHGRTWTLLIAAVSPVGGTASNAFVILGAGLLVTGALFALVWVIARAERRALRRVDEATAELSRQERHFRSLVANSTDLVLVTDAVGVLSYASPSCQRLLGRSEDDLVGQPSSTLVHPDDVRPLQAATLDDLREHRHAGPAEYRMARADGTWRWFEATAVNLLDDPDVGGVVWTCKDVTERRAFEQDLAAQATHDHLTGLPNRALLLDRVEHALARGRRSGTSPALLFVDLDRFKLVNDSFGHAAGDDLLVEVAGRLAGALRPGDTVARFGGDEFVVLVEDVVDGADECRAIAERLGAVLAAPFDVAGQEVHVTASIGIVVADEERDRDAHTDPETLLRDADIAMYRAKEAGRGRTEVFDVRVRAGALRRLADESQLHRAVERGELDVHYQPQLTLDDQRIVGVEALVRWHHPERGLVLPDEFIDLAEDTGLITRIGRFVLDRACRDGYRWMQQRGETLSVSVNVSARELATPALVDTVAGALDSSGLPGEALCLEITETALMADIATAVETLHALRRLGVRIAIDDFGTGYASLGHLKQFPVDFLKIDRTFVAGLGHEAEDTVIVAAVIGLAHALGVTAVAEGVETEAQLAELRALRCDAAQGWLWWPALPPDEVDATLSVPV